MPFQKGHKINIGKKRPDMVDNTFYKNRKVVKIRLKKNCKTCNGEFLIHPYRKNTAFYCSRKCSDFASIGRKPSIETTRKIQESRKGYRHSEVTKAKMCISIKDAWKNQPEIKKLDFSKFATKRQNKLWANLEYREKMKNAHIGVNVGEKHPMWKGGVSKVKGYGRIYAARHRARKMNAVGTHTREEWEELKTLYNYMCLCCKKLEPEIKLTEDHIVPLVKGGSNFITNIQPLCGSCNSRKHDKEINYISDYYQFCKLNLEGLE